MLNGLMVTKDRMIKLWTIHPVSVWNTLNKTGTLRVSSLHKLDSDWLPAYKWMTAQMQKRLPSSPKDIAPIWSWLQWTNNRRMPDLRAAGHLEPGAKGVRLEIEVNPNRVLLSDFDLWHNVLNYSWHEPLPPALHRREEKSWEDIFEVKAKTKSIQGTLWAIHLDDVKSVTHFEAR
jgi:hypothetical protein